MVSIIRLAQRHVLHSPIDSDGLLIVPRQPRRNGNPEPWSCAKTVMPAKTRRVDSPTSHLEHSCIPASGWMVERALDSRCGENDGWI